MDLVIFFKEYMKLGVGKVEVDLGGAGVNMIKMHWVKFSKNQ